MTLVEAMVKAGASSHAWSRRMIQAGLVSVNYKFIKNISATVKRGDIIFFGATTWTVE